MAAAIDDINLDPTFADIDRSARAIMEPPGWKYWVWIGFLATLIAIAIGLWTRQIYEGLQVTGMGDPVMWAVYITNFVFWVGIAHSGTLISAILFLFRTRWRTAVYRAAETMTIFAVATAGLFPVIHLGRAWFFYWLAPYPNQRYLQPDFRSPLTWDLFAIGTYLTISSLFWFTGLIPDVANVREVATGWRKQLYTIVAMGWQGSDRQWRHFSMAYLLLAGLATPLVLSVHSVVSWDFAMAQLPGWHSTIFAPYFVAGAIFSGVAMVLTLLIPMRWVMGLEDLITPWHLDNLAKVILLTSLIISYAYVVESFMAWYSQDPIEMMTFHMRYFGPWGWMFWVMVLCNCLIPLALFSPRIRVSPVPLFIITIFVNIGMWFERFVIIAGSLAVNFEPSQWRFWHPSITEMGITVGSFAWFVMLFSLFARFMPIISMTELKEGITWLRQALRQGYAKAA
ncbi:MAG: NrfD/PsrC family molybdoenzyme membrane anchor subunit [Candidatus Binataceae bacterium]